MIPRDRTVLIVGLATGVVPALLVALFITSASGSRLGAGVFYVVAQFGLPAGMVWALVPFAARRLVRFARGGAGPQMLGLFIGIVIAAVILVIAGLKIGGQIFGDGLTIITVLSGLVYCGIVTTLIVRSVPKPPANRPTALGD